MRKPKSNRRGPADVSQPFDRCQTPAYALDPLLPLLPAGATIWEPACGNGNIDRVLRQAGHPVISTDILGGVDFFQWEPDRFDIIVTNPPYSCKYDWLRRCYALGRPFALLVPIDTLGAKAAQRLFKKHGFEWMLLDRRVNFEMPLLGFEGNGAHFSTFWCCWGLLPEPVMFEALRPRAEGQLLLDLEAA